jgi:hypothetical protein
MTGDSADSALLPGCGEGDVPEVVAPGFRGGPTGRALSSGIGAPGEEVVDAAFDQFVVAVARQGWQDVREDPRHDVPRRRRTLRRQVDQAPVQPLEGSRPVLQPERSGGGAPSSSQPSGCALGSPRLRDTIGCTDRPMA